MKKFFLLVAFLLMGALVVAQLEPEPITTIKTTSTTIPMTDTEKITKISQDTQNILSNLGNVIQICNNIYNKPTMSTSGTEYYPNEAGRVFLRLLDGNSKPINLGSCNTTIYYPNNTKFINNQQMMFLENGYYYDDFTTPNTTGNYIVGFDCLFPSNIFNQTQILNWALSTANPFYGYFPFDDSDNVTINNATFKAVTSGGGTANIYFNGKLIFSGVGGTYTAILNSSDFVIGSSQNFVATSAGGITLVSTNLYVNYTANPSTQIIRGQNEMHIRNIATVNYTNNQTFLFNVSFNGTVNITNNVTVNVTENITQFNDTNIIQNITSLSNNMGSNFTNTNSLIISVNNTVNFWGGALNSTLSTLNYWGNLLNATMNFWGNALETKIDNIIMGNVTVTAVVDYDKIALFVISYLKTVEKIKVV